MNSTNKQTTSSESQTKELYADLCRKGQEAIRMTVERGHYTPEGEVVYTKRANIEWSFSPRFAGRSGKLGELAEQLYQEAGEQAV